MERLLQSTSVLHLLATEEPSSDRCILTSMPHVLEALGKCAEMSIVEGENKERRIGINLSLSAFDSS